MASDDAAKKAVREVFRLFDVDVDDPKSIKEFREDLRFGGQMRKYADRGMIVLVTVVTGAMALALWEGLVANIKKSIM
ncbi:MAG: hypothetical protein H6937_06920 [Burkholderiales bacterium]|nr:hypothetical protein [Burkholderiales bacterium]